MLTSLAPSPIARHVFVLSSDLTKFTMSAFCFGDTLEHMTHFVFMIANRNNILRPVATVESFNI